MSDVTNYLIEFYLSLIAYYVLHMIFVISSDFVEAFNIPPLNIGIYVDKLAAIRALLMVIADAIEYGCLDKAANDAGKSQYKLTEGYGQYGPRRLGSIASYLGMLSCRITYLVLIYNSDNKSLTVFITLCVEGFWFGVFQMSFFAIGPKYNAVTSFGIHTMGNFIFFIQVILQHESKSKPKINCLYRVRVHGWIVLITSLIALGAWLYFCLMEDAGDEDSSEFKALKDEPYWFETNSFNELVTELKKKLETKLENETDPDHTKVAEKIREALKDTTVTQKITSVVQKDFGISGKVTVEEQGKNVEVKINSSNDNLGTPATVTVEKDSKSETITIQVKGQTTLDANKGGNIAKRLVKAVEIAASGVDKLKSFTVNSTDENETKVQGYLAEKLRDAGSEKYKELVDQLKKQGGFNSSSDRLDKNNLKTALESAKAQIKDLLDKEFSVTVEASNINANPDSSGSKVTVTITGKGSGSEQKGYSLIKQNTDKNIQNPIDIEVQFNQNVTGATADNAEKLAHRLVRAVETAKFGTNPNLVEALIQSKMEFGYSNEQNVSVSKDSGNTKVTVKIGSGGSVKGKATVKIKKGSSADITIEVNGARSKSQANRIAYKLGQGLISNKNKFPAVSISSDKIDGDTINVWSPFWLFIVGAFAEDFSVPGILPFAFLDPEKANLVNYLTPSFFMSGAMVIVFLNDVFEVKGFAKDLVSPCRFKDWSEGAANGWHSLWLLNIPKYLAFFIAMWSVHGTFENLRCIIQSRWRVLLLTMIVVVPRATLEVAGYVGVANYAIHAKDTSDYSGFQYIAWHDMLAMFCRFVYVKFAVGYNQLKYVIYIVIVLLMVFK